METKEDGIHFNLLRCSTNFDGPTAEFAFIDNDIIYQVNETANQLFDQPVKFNHVLAQIYENVAVVDNDTKKIKEKKAKIKNHSDKTKDMPRNGLIAFCTFYSSDIEKYKFEDTSALTRLRFRRKNSDFEFIVPLYPNSLLIISLSTNRHYTHEITPSTLSIAHLPIRLGYVIRCSNTEAIFKEKENATYIRKQDRDYRLEPPTVKDIEELRAKYLEENKTKIM